MARQTPVTLAIAISKSGRTLTLTETAAGKSSALLQAGIVSGCDESGTPSGTYTAGKWVKDKTNPTHGPKPWTKDPWGNPYGPYFLPLNNRESGRYTTYGIHGTRGPLVGNFEKPPVPEGVLRFFVGDDQATKFLYCSHGCVRLSNQNITKLYEITVQPKYVGRAILVSIK